MALDHWIYLFFLLLCGHSLADFALQNEWIATNKNRHIRDHFSPEEKRSREIIWPWLMTAHALHHAALVYLVTQRVHLAIIEAVVHWITDFGKCEGWYGFHVDQVLHVVAKAIYVVLIAYAIV